MEAVGLAVSLAGLATIFQSCMAAYNLVGLIAKYGTDHEILLVKVEVERIRLLEWGYAVGLLADSSVLEGSSPYVQDVDPRLSRQYLRTTIESILVCLKRIFEDTDALTSRYGLKQEKTKEVTAEVDTTPGLFKNTFKSSYDRFEKMAAVRQMGSPLTSKFRWVIQDKKRLEQLLEDIKGFNDSLNNLMPGTKEIALKRLNEQIINSTDIRQLETLRKATEGNEDAISETASLRIEALSIAPSRRQPLPVTDANQDPTDNVAVSLSGLAFTGEVDDGYLQIMWGGDDRTVNFFVSCKGDDRQSRSVGHHEAHPSFVYRKVSVDEGKYYAAHVIDRDPEASPEYEGFLPGTLTPSGFGLRVTRTHRAMSPTEYLSVYSSTTPIPALSIGDMLPRVEEFKKPDYLLAFNERLEYGRLEKWLGPERTTWVDPNQKFQISEQISRLTAQLNRRDLPGLDDEWYISNPLIKGFADFLYVLLLAMELNYRLQAKADHTLYVGISFKVPHDLLAAKLWRENMDASVVDGNLVLKSSVYQRQAEGILAFAETMEWPFISEVRERIEAKLHDFDFVKIPGNEMDWFMGVMLPGKKFSNNIMRVLVNATPSIPKNALNFVFSMEVGIILPTCSYWRSTTIVGKVLGALPHSKAAAGWIGPCPAVTGADPYSMVGDPSRQVNYDVKKKVHSTVLWDTNEDGTDKDLSLVVPKPPLKSKDVCKLQSICLSSTSTIARPNTLPKKQAKLDFMVNEKKITLQLHADCSFISLPTCIGGHRRPATEVKVLELRELEGVQGLGNTLIVINATAEHGEVLARAWCANRGLHGVVCKSRRTCYSCGIDITRHMDVKVMIWS